MATTDKARLLGSLRRAETEMDELFVALARDVGQVVLNAANDDGTVPAERLPQIRAQVTRLVDQVFLGHSGGRPFDEQNRPMAPFPRIIAEGQRAQIEVALERVARTFERLLPADVRDGITRRWLQRGRQ